MNLSLRKTFNANQNSRARTLSFGVDSSEQHHATAFPPMAHQSQSSSGPDWSYLVGCLFPAPSPEWFSGVSEKKKTPGLLSCHICCVLDCHWLCCVAVAQVPQLWVHARGAVLLLLLPNTYLIFSDTLPLKALFMFSHLYLSLYVLGNTGSTRFFLYLLLDLGFPEGAILFCPACFFSVFEQADGLSISTDSWSQIIMWKPGASH